MTIDPSSSPTTLWTRRDVLRRGAYAAGGLTLLGVGGSWLTACGSSDSSGSNTTASASGAATSLGSASLQLVWVMNVQFAGSYIASTNGYYEDEGIDVKLEAGGPTVVVEPNVIAGASLVGIAGGETIAAAIEKGAELKVIAAGFQKSPVCVMSLSDNPIRTPQDMVGKKIGVPAASLVSFQAFETVNGIDPASVTIVPVQFDPTPLTAGEVDGYFGYSTNEPTVLRLEGYDVTVMMFGDFGMPMLSELYIATAESLADPDERAKVVALMRGEIRGWQEAVVNFPLAADLAVNVFGKDLGLSLEEQTIEAEEQAKLIVTPETDAHGLMWMTDEMIEETVNSLVLSGIPATTDMFDTSLLADVYQGRTSL